MRQGRLGTAARRGIRLHGSTAAAMQKIVIGGAEHYRDGEAILSGNVGKLLKEPEPQPT